jgi:ABC-type thiamine transport system ATPase subunit
MLTLETVRYEQDEFVLSADWRLAPEARVAVIGPSGAGKSTLLSLIGGFITPQSGRLLWDGQASRAALARALCQDKPLLLLDEPFAALGPALRHEMLDLVGEIAREHRRAVLMVSHEPRDAKHFADAVIVVADGVAQPPQDTATLFAKPPKALRDYLGHH